jgi:hypothetical protein
LHPPRRMRNLKLNQSSISDAFDPMYRSATQHLWFEYHPETSCSKAMHALWRASCLSWHVDEPYDVCQFLRETSLMLRTSWDVFFLPNLLSLLRLNVLSPVQERSLERNMSLFSIPSNKEVERNNDHLQMLLLPRVVSSRPFPKLGLELFGNAP